MSEGAGVGSGEGWLGRNSVTMESYGPTVLLEILPSSCLTPFLGSLPNQI